MRNAENQVEARTRVRRTRRGVSVQDRDRWNSEICQRIAAMESFQSSTHVAGYLAFDGEADPLQLMTIAVEQGKQVYVPMIVGKGKPLKFAPWTPTIKLKPNRFGIPEPDVPESDWHEAHELDFVITPLVVFDPSCNRIGVGGGFYDLSFEFLKDDPHQIVLVGFAFELQKVEFIVPNDWDVPLTAVVTESRLYRS